MGEEYGEFWGRRGRGNLIPRFSLRSVETGRREPWERGWGGGSDVAMFTFIYLGYDNFLSTEKVAARLHRKL